MLTGMRDLYQDYCIDPGLARLREKALMAWPDLREDQPGLVVVADSPLWLNGEEWHILETEFEKWDPYLIYVLKFPVEVARHDEWQATKALVRREIALLKPKAWIPVGPVSCELLAVQAWNPQVAAVQVDYNHTGAPVVQGKRPNALKTLEILFETEKGFHRRED